MASSPAPPATPDKRASRAATFGNLATASGVAAEQCYPALLIGDVRHWPLAGVCVVDVRPTSAVLRLEGSSPQHTRGLLDAALAVATDGIPATAASG